MRTITKIEAQKKQKNRVSVFLEGEFAFGLDLATLAKFNLKKGDGLDEQVIAEIQSSAEKSQIRECAFRYLAGRPHSEFELSKKLQLKGFAEPQVKNVLDELRKAQFIDDGEFAVSYARSRLLTRPIGRHLLRQELKQKGVRNAEIEKAITTAFAEVSERDLASRLLERRKSRYRDLPPEQQKKRLHDFLLRRGFDWEVINETMAIHD